MYKNITNRQISLMLYCLIVGYGVINLPKNAAQSAGTGAWISLLIVTFIFILTVYIITYLQYVYDGKIFYEYSEKLLGKWLTYLVTIIFIIYFFIFFSMISRIYCETIKLTILNNTPVIYLCALFYMVICYGLFKGINTIARLCEIYGTISIISVIFINSALFTQGKLSNIRPFFSAGDIMIYLKSVTKLIFPFLGIELLFFIPFNRSKNKNIFKYTTFIIFFIGILYIYIVESTTSVIGIDSIINYNATVFSVIRGVDISYLNFFRRLDGIYIMFWTMNVVCAVNLLGYGLAISINKLFKINTYKTIVIVISIIAFITSQIPKSINEINLIIKYTSYLGGILGVILPYILLIITKVKKYDKNI